MGTTEHERKFTVADISILSGSVGNEIEQGYMWAADGWAIRARRTYIAGDELTARDEGVAMITIKGPRSGQSRPEYEVPVDSDHARALIAASSKRIQKTRHPIISEGLTWEIDVFHGDNEGLVIAEIEMANPSELATVKRPWWAGEDVTMDERYANENLAAHPWQRWLTRDSD